MTISSAHVTGSICVALLFVPLLLSRCGTEEGATYLREVEQRQPAEFPTIRSPWDLVDASVYTALNAALRDRLPYRARIITLAKRVELAMPGNTGKRDVLITDEGWFFLNAAFGRRLGSPSDVQESLDLVDAFLAEHRDPPPVFRFMLVPDKHSVYPERLDQAGRTEASVYAPSRERLEDHFASHPDPRIIDMRAIILAEKAVNPNLLYQPGDTHHSDHGAMVMARSLLDSLAPGLWRADEVVELGVEDRTADLHNLSGLVDLTEQYPVVTVERAGFEGVDIEWLDELDIMLRPARYRAESRGAKLLPGRALIVHDSFIGPTLRPVFAQYFEDLTYWYNELIEPGDLRAAMKVYDYVIVEGTVREATRMLAQVFGEATGEELEPERASRPEMP
jgi:hypothetical protein